MVYIEQITLPDEYRECQYLQRDDSIDPKPGRIEIKNPKTGKVLYEKYNFNVNRECFTSDYPFKILSGKLLNKVDFSDVTLLCGGNGSGKSTLLNIIAQKLQLKRETPYNRSVFFDDYLLLCDVSMPTLSYESDFSIDTDGRIITSDDVFDYNLRIREQNDLLDIERERLFHEHKNTKRNTSIDFDDAESIRRYKEVSRMKRHTGSSASRSYLGHNPMELSNGESGFQYFIDQIQPGGLYLLDEPENSLSANLQIELKRFIEAMAEYHDCQFIIASHSPFILSIKDAFIYDLDTCPVKTTEWEFIDDVKMYRDFFEDEIAERQMRLK